MNSTQDCCIIAVGSTGSGKSSVVRAVTGADVQRSSGVESVTKAATTFRNPETHQIWLDTMGTQDSEEKLSDDEILRDILRSVQQNDIQCIKVLWFIKPDNRKTSVLKAQARFIQSLLHADVAHGQNVWDSVVMIVKEGEPDDDEQTQGAQAAAAEYGAPLSEERDEQGVRFAKIPWLGFTCLDWLSEKKRARKMKACKYTPKEEWFSTFGFLEETDVVTFVGTMLDERMPINMHFKMQMCLDCGVTGDKRCVPLECHDEPREVHPEASSFVHLEELAHNHPQRLNQFHDGIVESFHGSEEVQAYHPHGREQVHAAGTESYRFHPGLLSDNYHSGHVESFHPASLTSRTEPTGERHHLDDAVLQCPAGHKVKGDAFSPSSRYTKYPCSRCHSQCYGQPPHVFLCDQCPRDLLLHPKAFQICHRCPVRIHACCGRGSGADGCQTTQRAVNIFSCCGRDSNSYGCTQRYTCCSTMIGSVGCGVRYTCCQRLGGSDGCQTGKRYSCCKTPVGSVGCQTRYSCCKANVASDGCRQRYVCCGRDIGQTGCRQRHSCCHKILGSGGCQKKFLCCDGESDSEGCQSFYPCCGVVMKGGLSDSLGCAYKCCERPAGSGPCEKQCRRCGQSWGQGVGCTLKEHNLRDL